MAQTHTYTGDEPVRLNKWMASLGLCSRREAEALIEKGEVSVNGETVNAPGHKIAPGETMTLGTAGARALDEQLTVILHKPVGYVSAQPEAGQTPAARLVTKANLSGTAPKVPGRSTQLAPLGRLDMDSRGLLLLSEDGVLAKAVIGPGSGMEKEYLVTVKGQVTPQAISQLRNGLSLDGRRLKPAKIDQLGPGRLRFRLREGRNRQIRRMCELVGLIVVDLHRVRVGPLELGDLPEGKWRALTSEERASLLSSAGAAASASAGAQASGGAGAARSASARSRGKGQSGSTRAGPPRKR